MATRQGAANPRNGHELRVSRSRQMPHARETVAVIGLCVMVLAFNVFTASLFPIPWRNEVDFVDPAVNLVWGKGFSGSTFSWESASDTRAHHPLYSLVLSGWISLFGFSLGTTRTLNHFLVAMATLLIWFGTVRTDLVRTCALRLLLAGFLLCNYSLALAYRAGRVDILSLLLLATAFAVVDVRWRSFRWSVLFLCAALLPAVGLQNLLFLAVLGAGLFVVGERTHRPDVYVAAVGALCGSTALFGLYAFLGIADRAASPLMSAIDESAVGTGMFALALPRDPTLWLTLAAMLVWIARSVVMHRFTWRGIDAFGLWMGLAVPAAFLLFFRFPPYYSWMASIPMGLALCAGLSQNSTESIDAHRAWERSVRQLVLILIGFAMLGGLPLMTAVSIPHWPERNPEGVTTWASTLVAPDESVVTVPQAYFALKSPARTVVLPPHLHQLSADERKELSVVVTSPMEAAHILGMLPGDWESAGRFLPSHSDPGYWQELLGRNKIMLRDYELELYRRVE